MAETLADSGTAPSTRLLVLEFIAQAPFAPLPDRWIEPLGRSLADSDERVVRAGIAGLRTARIAQFDGALLGLAGNGGKSNELRIAAASAAVARQSQAVARHVQVDQPLFAFLLARLDMETPALERLAAASCLGGARLNDSQLIQLAAAVVQAGAMELPHLAAAYEGGKSPAVGLSLVSALERSPGRPSLSLEKLTAVLADFPPEVQSAAQPLVDRLKRRWCTWNRSSLSASLALARGSAGPRQADFLWQESGLLCLSHRRVGRRTGRPRFEQDRRHSFACAICGGGAVSSASFARGFEPCMIVTEDGRPLSGVIRRETTDTLELVTADRTVIRIPRTQVETIAPGKVSIMPEGLDNQLSTEELGDLIAFLSTLK